MGNFLRGRWDCSHQASLLRWDGQALNQLHQLHLPVHQRCLRPEDVGKGQALLGTQASNMAACLSTMRPVDAVTFQMCRPTAW